ncbi:ATP-dependent DNA/RNA helicase [Coemansia sp. Benny D115]|nr:ATP-dependent DNA/RNA helicase [Coemansia sp. Benny D115]
MDDKLLDKKTTFQSLDLDDRLLRALGQQGLVHPTLVQSTAIPLALLGKDILARAKTGSGKTAAYCLPLLHKILAAKDALPTGSPEAKKTRALILVPTRELAEQVTRYVADLTRFCGKAISVVNVARTTGSNIQQPLLAELPDVVVATPAKCLEHMRQGHLDLKTSLETLVIDEADLVLSFGYEIDVRGIVAQLPKIHQSLLLSATLNSGVETLKSLVLTNPAVLRLEDGEDEASKLVQYVVRCSDEEKFLLTFVILKLRLIAGKCILFVNSIDRSYRLKLFLEQFAIKACVLNSELPLNSRYHIVEEFNRGVYDYIIATDESDRMGEVDDAEEKEEKMEVDDASEETKKDDKADAKTEAEAEEAGEEGKKEEKKSRKSKKRSRASRDKEYGVSRGIDFKGVAAVINFDFPPTTRAYTHRVGRTARAGRRGMALSFVAKEDIKSNDRQHLADEAVFEAVALKQRKRGAGDILPYNFDMKQVEGFRYRSTDALNAITKTIVREARIKEIKQEILNSEKLKAHFEDKPKDLAFLRHDKALKSSEVLPHMKNIPTYLTPKIAGIKQADGVAVRPDVGFVPFNKDTKKKRAHKPRRGGGDPLKNLGKKRRK